MRRGWVPDVAQVSVTSFPGLGVIYYGLTNGDTSDEYILSLSSINAKNLTDSLVFSPVNQYLLLAYPRSLGDFLEFQYEGFPVGFPYDDRFITIAGKSVQYRVFISEYPQNGSNLILAPKINF